MIALPEDIAEQDVVQWLQGGYFLVLDADSADPRTAKLGRMVATEDGQVVTELADAGVERVSYDRIRCYWPTCGAINMPNGLALHVRRDARRQWCRTYRSRDVTVTIPGKWWCRKMGGRALFRASRDASGIARAVFAPSYPDSAEAAYASLENGDRVSVALNPYIIMAGRGPAQVYYRDLYAGTFTREDGFSSELAGPEEKRVRQLLGDIL